MNCNTLFPIDLIPLNPIFEIRERVAMRIQKNDCRDTLLVTGLDYLYDKRLTLKDKGLLALCLSLNVENKEKLKEQLFEIIKEDRKTIQDSYEQLLKYGYIFENVSDDILFIADYPMSGWLR